MSRTIIILLLLLCPSMTAAEWCRLKPDQSFEKDGYRWRNRTLEGRKCWYYSKQRLGREDLLWEYDRKEFDEDGVVTGRKLWRPEELKQ